MKAKILTFLLLFSAGLSFSQNWQTVNSGHIAYFSNSSSGVKALRIDSVKFQSDSILYPFSIIRQPDLWCYTPYGASWMGQSVVVSEGGANAFVNLEGDTIKLLTKAKAGTEWMAYQLADSLYVKANVVGCDTLTFLGLTDSVKTIGFTCYDKEMSPITHVLNTMQVQISKNYGFVQTLNFAEFPVNKWHFYPDENLEELTLVGLSKPEVGVQNLTWLQVNDFQVGDELHIVEDDDYFYYREVRSTILKYLSRANENDGVAYITERTQSFEKILGDSIVYSFTLDTISSVVKPYASFDKLPGEPIGNHNWKQEYSMAIGTRLSKTKNEGRVITYDLDSTCWSALIIDGCIPLNIYIEGLGGPYYSCDNNLDGGSSERKLVYYKKGEVTWGDPLLITSTNKVLDNASVKLYPNPAQEQFTIQTQGLSAACSYCIFDMQGRTIQQGMISNAQTSLSISDVEAGMYVVKVYQSNAVLKVEKLLVE